MAFSSLSLRKPVKSSKMNKNKNANAVFITKIGDICKSETQSRREGCQRGRGPRKPKRGKLGGHRSCRVGDSVTQPQGKAALYGKTPEDDWARSRCPEATCPRVPGNRGCRDEMGNYIVTDTSK